MNYEKDLYLMQQIYATIFALANKIQAKGDQSLQILTARQMMAMLAIIHLPGEKATYNNIAKKLGTTRQSVKQLIALMAKKGFVVTIPSEQDKRASNVQITELGKKAIIICDGRSLELMTDVFSQFTTQDMEILWKLLKKLYSYDGVEQDGFQENMNYESEEFFQNPNCRQTKNLKLVEQKLEREAESFEKQIQ
ncbi:MarR family transcriptional regulator [Clostridium sp. KNHs216]|uniref:MarR family winged helix-turn-helix transcriptional regulator n=1 Tax=Clostridium sp. KNHs216 TaxID=1550235 RepID=UPI001153913B|nr:MarR family transcriptional regulator [Clostridium sp. KNHs216]TQI69038.1 DNA-binding MarR family transcriptional regulator [Clostridium sp. KNHs216]